MTDVTLLNTRPLAQQQETHDAFTQAGFKVIDFPCIDIQIIPDSEPTIEQLNTIVPNDTLIFTSQHAVHYAFELCPQLSFNENILITVGTKTAETLEQHCSCDIFIPKKQNSEGVIALLQGLKQLNTVHLITAPEGREQIQNFALKNNINLQQINVYQRTLPHISNHALEEIKQCHSLSVLATSITTIKNLKQLVTEELWGKICTSTLICASSRIENYAIQQGFEKCYNSNTAKPSVIAEKIMGSMMK